MKIRKEIKSDGSFGGNYPYNIDYPNLPENLVEIDEQKAQEIDQNADKFRYINGEIADISETPEYITAQTLKTNATLKANLQTQIDEFDKKRIRAIAEPALKDEESGQTWLEFYTIQIQDLRNQIRLV